MLVGSTSSLTFVGALAPLAIDSAGSERPGRPPDVRVVLAALRSGVIPGVVRRSAVEYSDVSGVGE